MVFFRWDRNSSDDSLQEVSKCRPVVNLRVGITPHASGHVSKKCNVKDTLCSTNTAIAQSYIKNLHSNNDNVNFGLITNLAGTRRLSHTRCFRGQWVFREGRHILSNTLQCREGSGYHKFSYILVEYIRWGFCLPSTLRGKPVEIIQVKRSENNDFTSVSSKALIYSFEKLIDYQSQINEVFDADKVVRSRGHISELVLVGEGTNSNRDQPSWQTL